MFERLAAPLIVTTLVVASATGGSRPSSQDDGDAVSVDPPTRRVVVPEGVRGGDRPPLLREGGILVKVPGTISIDERLGVHVFHPEVDATSGIRRELLLLPSRGLEDLDRLERLPGGSSAGSRPRRFEVTGQVLVYRGRNFILPDAVYPVTEGETPSEAIPPAPADEPATEPVEGERDDDSLDRIGDELERRLEARVGAIPRSLDLREAPASEQGTVPTGSRFVDRRGRLSRDPASGVWRFVLAGDGGQRAAPSVILLPCLELERIEADARQADVSTPILLSGTVTNFRGRSYLLPTMSRPAIEGRGLGH